MSRTTHILSERLALHRALRQRVARLGALLVLLLRRGRGRGGCSGRLGGAGDAASRPADRDRGDVGLELAGGGRHGRQAGGGVVDGRGGEVAGVVARDESQLGGGRRLVGADVVVLGGCLGSARQEPATVDRGITTYGRGARQEVIVERLGGLKLAEAVTLGSAHDQETAEWEAQLGTSPNVTRPNVAGDVRYSQPVPRGAPPCARAP